MRRAAKDAPFAIIDGSPGIGCPVIASLSGVDMALIVAEPSVSGISDLERIYQNCRCPFSAGQWKTHCCHFDKAAFHRPIVHPFGLRWPDTHSRIRRILRRRRDLLILSGKGGTGKTTVASAFIKLSEAQAFADCDVDAPNLVLPGFHCPDIYLVPRRKVYEKSEPIHIPYLSYVHQIR